MAVSVAGGADVPCGIVHRGCAFFPRSSLTVIRLSTRICSLPKVRTNYGMYNIRFKGPQIWNSIDEITKLLKFSASKEKIKSDFINNY